MGRLFDIVDAYRDSFAPHQPSYSKVAEEVGVSKQTLMNWRRPKELLDKDYLLGLVRVTRVPYESVLNALLEDIGYLRADQEVVTKRRRKAATVTELTPRERSQQIQKKAAQSKPRTD
jgi:transposase-like protein